MDVKAIRLDVKAIHLDVKATRLDVKPIPVILALVCAAFKVIHCYKLLTRNAGFVTCFNKKERTVIVFRIANVVTVIRKKNNTVILSKVQLGLIIFSYLL